MRTISKFVAHDGSEFYNENDCIIYDNLCREIDTLCLDWPMITIRDEGGFVQQDKTVVLRIQRSMVAIFERLHWKDQHTEWARTADNPAGMSLIGRYVDDAGTAPESKVWRRIQRLDNLFREYEQPYYAIQANRSL